MSHIPTRLILSREISIFSFWTRIQLTTHERILRAEARLLIACSNRVINFVQRLVASRSPPGAISRLPHADIAVKLAQL